MWRYNVHKHRDNNCGPYESVPLDVESTVFALERRIPEDVHTITRQFFIDNNERKSNVDVLRYEHFIEVCHHLV